MIDPAKLIANSSKLHEASSALSARVVAFEDYLNSLPGKVPSAICREGAIIDGRPVYLGLMFKRDGRAWKIYAATGPDAKFDGAEWKPLTELSIPVKIEAVSLFAPLLNQLQADQLTSIDRIGNAVRDVERLLNDLPSPAVGVTAGG